MSTTAGARLRWASEPLPACFNGYESSPYDDLEYEAGDSWFEMLKSELAAAPELPSPGSEL